MPSYAASCLKYPIILISALFLILPFTPAKSLAGGPSVVWQTTINAPVASEPYSVGYDVKAGPGTNVHLGGYNWGGLGGTWDWEHEPIVVKFKNNTSFNWLDKLDSSSWGHTYCQGVDTDSAGNIYAVGYTWGTLPGGGRVNPDEPFDNTDLYAVKYDSAGAVQWLRQIGTDGYNDKAWAVVYDSAGYVYVVGETGGDMEGMGMTPYGYQDILVLKLSASNGATVWVRQLGTAGYDAASGVAIDSSGGLYVCGYTGGTLQGEFNFGGDDIFLTKLDTGDGSHVWTRLTGTTGNDYGEGMDVDGSGSIYIGGSTDGSFPPAVNPDSGSDFCVVKYSPSGVEQWVSQLTSSGDDAGYDLAVDTYGNSFIIGTTSGDFDGHPSLGGGDFAVVKYSKDGDRIWSWLYGSDAVDGGFGIDVNPSGKIFVTGYVSGMLGSTIPMIGVLDMFAIMLDQELTSVVTAPADGVNLTGTAYTITGAADRGTGPPVLKVEVSPDGGANWYNATDTSGDGSWSTWSYYWTLPSEGDYNIKSRVTDTSLFVETPSAGVFISVDNTKPVGSVTINSGDAYTAYEHVTLTLSASDFSGVASMRFSNYSTSGWSAWEPYNTDMQWTIPTGDGTKTVYARFMDSHGNESDISSDDIFLDVNNPFSSITNPTGGAYLSGASHTITGTSGDGSGSGVTLVEVSINGGAWQAATGTATWSYNWTLPADGVYTVRSRATDAAGRVETPGAGVTVTVDNSGPTGPAPFWTRLRGTSANDAVYDVSADELGMLYIGGSTQSGLDGNTNLGGADSIILKYDNNGNWIWTKQFGTGSDDDLTAIASDAIGNTYSGVMTTGSFGGYSSLGDFDVYIVKHDTAGNLLWTRQFGTGYIDSVDDVVVDANGNLYAIGSTNGELDGNMSAGGYDYYLIKYDSEGNKQWTRQHGTPGSEGAEGVAFDSNGNIFVCGYTTGSFPGFSNSGFNDIYVVKYDPGGNLLWTYQMGDSNTDFANAVAVDGSGNAYVTGYTNNWLDGIPLAGIDDAFLVKLDANGNKEWTRLLGSSGRDWGLDLSIDRNNNIFMSGFTEGNLDGNTLIGGRDIFTAKYDTEGNRLWTRQLGTLLGESAFGITSDIANNIYITGWTLGSLYGNSNAGGMDLFLMKLSGSNAIVINNDDLHTISVSVTLSLNAADPSGVAEMRFSNHSTSGWSGWQNYATTAPWTLESSGGTMTVYARFRDILGNESDVFYDTISFEDIPPVTSISDPVEGGVVTSASYTVTGTADDGPLGSGVAGVVVSTDGGLIWSPAADTSGNGSWSTWSYDWTVPDAGPYNITSKATDNLGNIESPGPGVNVTAKSTISADRPAVSINYNLARPPATTAVVVSGQPWDIDCAVSSTQPWLSVSPSSGATPSEFVLTVDPTGMSAGNYTTTVTVTSALGANSPFGIPFGITVTDGPFGPELEHYEWEAFLTGGDCETCHVVPDVFISGPHEPHEPDCRSCHNSAAVAHESPVAGAYGHSVMASVTSAGIVAPTYGNVTAAEYNNQPFANLEGGDLVVCSTCHNAMRKTEDNARVWEMTATTDRLTYYLESGGWAGYGRPEPVVYISNGLISAPAYSRARKAYVVDAAEYTYDETAGTVTFAAAQDPADYVYVTLKYPYLRASSEGNRLCSDCHGQSTHMGLNCLACHSAHNTDNLAGIRSQIRTPSGGMSSVTFTSYSGPGSFGDGSGTGLCEVCHTQTLYFRYDGGGFSNHTTTGESYDGKACTDCHGHDTGFHNNTDPCSNTPSAPQIISADRLHKILNLTFSKVTTNTDGSSAEYSRDSVSYELWYSYYPDPDNYAPLPPELSFTDNGDGIITATTHNLPYANNTYNIYVKAVDTCSPMGNRSVPSNIITLTNIDTYP